MNEHLKNVTIDEMQLYLAKGAKLHPHTYIELINKLFELKYKRKVCPLPLAILEQFNYRVKKVA